MEKCKTCYLTDAKPCYECSACAGGDDHYKYWPNTQTNVDRIRGMTNERLAEIIAADFTGEKIPFCISKPECDKILDSGEVIPESMCVDCALDWLQKEVTNER